MTRYRCYSLYVLTLCSKPRGPASSFLRVRPPASPEHSICSPRLFLCPSTSFSMILSLPPLKQFCSLPHRLFFTDPRVVLCIELPNASITSYESFRTAKSPSSERLSLRCNAFLLYELRISVGVARASPPEPKSVTAWVRMDLVLGNKIAVLPEGLSAIVLIGSDEIGNVFPALTAFKIIREDHLEPRRFSRSVAALRTGGSYSPG